MAQKDKLKKKPDAPAAPASDAAPEKKKGGVFSIPNGAVGVMLMLLNIPLHGELSRARNRLVRIFDARRMVCLKRQEEMQQRYAEKNKDGSFQKPPEGAPEPYVISPQNMKAAEKEFIAFLDEPFELDLDPETKRALVMFRPKVLESQVQMDTSTGTDYDTICQAFEAI